jgi:hypothetical protein
VQPGQQPPGIESGAIKLPQVYELAENTLPPELYGWEIQR